MSLSAAQKAAQKNKKKKESGRFLQGVKTEMKKVIWPTRKELINYTVMVIVATLVVMAIIAVSVRRRIRMESEKNWYVIHTYSGYEKKVKDNLERKVRSMGLENVIERILVPEEDEIDVKDGRKRTVRRKIYPGYVFVEMEVNDRSWYVVRNTPGVTGFVGSATKPVPLEPQEVRRILKSQGIEKEVRPQISVEIGEQVRIISGPFDNFYATITEINNEKGTLKGLIDMFGRETSVEVDYSQIEKSLE